MTIQLARYRFRRGTAAEWAVADLILGEGEPGFESDSTPEKVKVGDGFTPWSLLDYFNPGEVNATADLAYELYAVAAGTVGTVTLNLALATSFSLTPTGHVTSMVLSNIPATKAVKVTLEVVQGTTPYNIATPSTGVFISDPTPVQQANKRCMFTYYARPSGIVICSAGVQA